MRRLSALFVILVLLLTSFAQTALALTPADYDSQNPQNLTADMLNCGAAILVDADSGDVLFGKNERVRMHPASTTKIMTLLLGIEAGFDLNSQIAIPQAAADIARDSSIVPVFPGETMTYGDLLTGFMLNSGNDGANAIAVLVAGSVEAFVQRMNQRALQIGCIDTHFANAHGLTDESHYTTAYDMALITRTAMQNETFRQIVAKDRATITVNERGPVIVGDKNFMLMKNSRFYYDGCIGVKTGFTSAAGKCFVGAAEQNGATLISVVFKCADERPADGQPEPDVNRWVDTTRLFNYGWTRYDTYTFDQMFEVASPQMVNCVISNASEDDPFGGKLDLEIAQISNAAYQRKVERNNPDALSIATQEFVSRAQLMITHDLTAPISKGEIIGDFSYYDAFSGSTITAKLIASRDVAEHIERATLMDYFPFLRMFQSKIFLLLLAVLALLVLLIMILVASRRAARQRRRRRIYEQRRAEYLRRQREDMNYSRRPPQRSQYSDGGNRYSGQSRSRSNYNARPRDPRRPR